MIWVFIQGCTLPAGLLTCFVCWGLWVWCYESIWLTSGRANLPRCMICASVCARVCTFLKVCVPVLVRGWKTAQPPTWKLMLSTVGGHLFLVAACRAETNSDCSAFRLWSSVFRWKYKNRLKSSMQSPTQSQHLIYYYQTSTFTAYAAL